MLCEYVNHITAKDQLVELQSGYIQGGETVGYERFTFEYNTKCIR